MGLPLEFYARMDWVESMLDRTHLQRGPGILRADHVNCGVADVAASRDWYARRLGFRCTEYFEPNEPAPRLAGAFLARRGGVHDLAVTAYAAPSVHHVAFWVENALATIRACDVLHDAGWTHSIEYGLGRHSSHALFLYLRDPDGHRVEIYTGDYSTADPDLPPVRRVVGQADSLNLWGASPPPSWFAEVSPCENVRTGELMPQTPSAILTPQR